MMNDRRLNVDGKWRVYGSRISYYTGKLEAYLRLRGIDYEILPVGGNQKKLIAATGVSQMPVVQMSDGRWMTDTSPILAWLDSTGEASEPSIYPQDPALRFAALLIEDYADEWLWRPAMHYRWSYRIDRNYAAETLYDEQIRATLGYPRFLGKAFLTRRQYGGFVRGDGIDEHSRIHAEQTYAAALAAMEAILAERLFLLGNRPTIADFGMMAPMFRHFGQDPTPSEIMRTSAPQVFAWVARMWALNASAIEGGLIEAIDGPLMRFLREIAETHLVQLAQNAEAFTRGQMQYDLSVQSTQYRGVSTSRYRVWCLECLRAAWTNLPNDASAKLRELLRVPECSILWNEAAFSASGYDPDGEAPFNRAINVFPGAIPGRRSAQS